MDLAVLAAAWFVLVQAPRSLVDANWVPNLDPLPNLAFAGLLVGWLIDRSRLPGVIGLPLGVLLGFEAVTWVYAQVAIVGSHAGQLRRLVRLCVVPLAGRIPDGESN